MNEVDFIDEIFIPCHGIRECRIGYAVSVSVSEEISIMVQTDAIV